MNVALRKPWTVERFLAWAERQGERFEFDGERPVAMTGGTSRHDRITGNISFGLRMRLRGKPCSTHGPNLGVQTVGSKIRYPDALITCTKFSGSAKLAPDVTIVFEVVSPGSENLDRVVKVREYQAVPSIRRYVIVDSGGVALQAFYRREGADPWTVETLGPDETLKLPEVAIEVPVAELYEDVVFDEAEPDSSASK